MYNFHSKVLGTFLSRKNASPTEFFSSTTKLHSNTNDRGVISNVLFLHRTAIPCQIRSFHSRIRFGTLPTSRFPTRADFRPRGGGFNVFKKRKDEDQEDDFASDSRNKNFRKMKRPVTDEEDEDELVEDSVPMDEATPPKTDEKMSSLEHLMETVDWEAEVAHPDFINRIRATLPDSVDYTAGNAAPTKVAELARKKLGMDAKNYYESEKFKRRMARVWDINHSRRLTIRTELRRKLAQKNIEIDPFIRYKLNDGWFPLKDMTRYPIFRILQVLPAEIVSSVKNRPEFELSEGDTMIKFKEPEINDPANDAYYLRIKQEEERKIIEQEEAKILNEKAKQDMLIHLQRMRARLDREAKEALLPPEERKAKEEAEIKKNKEFNAVHKQLEARLLSFLKEMDTEMDNLVANKLLALKEKQKQEKRAYRQTHKEEWEAEKLKRRRARREAFIKYHGPEAWERYKSEQLLKRTAEPTIPPAATSASASSFIMESKQ